MNEMKEVYRIAVQAAYAKKGYDIAVLDMRSTSLMADNFVIVSARNAKQAQAIADNIDEFLKKDGYLVRHKEGYAGGSWILLDAGEMVVHIFTEAEREYYGLENVWADVERIPFDGEQYE